MTTGIIKKLVVDRGYGFITPSQGEKDLFFHASTCQEPFDELSEAQTVIYDQGSDDQGRPRAMNVRSTDWDNRRGGAAVGAPVNIPSRRKNVRRGYEQQEEDRDW